MAQCVSNRCKDLFERKKYFGVRCTLMSQVNWPVVDTIHTLSNKFAMGVKIKATGELKLNDCFA